VRQVAFDGFRSSAPAELLGAAIVLALAVAIVLLFFAPSAPATAWIERRFAARLRAAAMDRRLGDPTFVIVGAAVTAVLVVAPFRQYRFAAGLDASIVFLVITSALLTVSLVTGGGAAEFSFGGALGALWRAFSRHVPAVLAVIGVIVFAGSLRVQDIVRAQGGAPWDWYAFRSPITLALFVAFVAAIGADGDDAPSTLAEATIVSAQEGAVSARVRFYAMAKWAGIFASCAVAVALFLGGWQMPGVDVAQGGQGSAPLSGAIVFALKTWALVGAVVLGRRALPVLRGEDTARVAWRWLVPIALVSLALAFGWRLWSPPRAVDRLASRVLFVAALLFAAHLAYRVRYGLRSPHAHAHVNPFL
jgi:NADH-quinone oxidoreductase subunit H